MDVFEGRISSCGFESGDRVVIGDWKSSPLGSFTNIMWARPDGARLLLSPSQKHADYVSGLYNFEDVKIVPISISRSKNGIKISSDELEIDLQWGRAFPFPLPRPRWFLATVENFFARLFFGTRTFGRTRKGQREWYCVRGISWIKNAKATYKGKSLNGMRPFQATACFGFSEPPKRPASIIVRSMIEQSS